MYAIIYLLAAATTAIIALVAIWAARSSLHWFWRAAALLTCFVLLVPVGAAELNLLFAPMAAILFAASMTQQWWERRLQRAEPVRAEDTAAAPFGSNRPRAPWFRVSLKELFLVLFLAAVAAWVIARIVQEGIVLDWRKLPIAVALVSAVAWIAFWWTTRPRPWPASYATSAGYVLGIATALGTMYALIYGVAWESASDITIASAGAGCLAMLGIRTWLRFFGGLLPAGLLVAAICAAVYVEVRYLGDWLAWEYLLWERPPTFWLERQIIYAMMYSLLALFVLAGAAVWRGLALPIRQSWPNGLLCGLSALALLVAVVPLGWWYSQLLDRPQLHARPAAGEDLLAEANRLVERIQELRRQTGSPAAPYHFALPDSPRMRRLTADLIAVLETASRESTHSGLISQPRGQQQRQERERLMYMATQIFGLDDSAMKHDHAEFALAQVRYATLAQRQGLAPDVKLACTIEQFGHLHLAMQLDRLHSDRMRELMRELEELDARREPLESILARDAAWSERVERWRSRLRRVLLKRETSADTRRALDTVRDAHNSCVATARMSYTNLAIQSYRRENGRLPSTLDQLVPEYLHAVPIDPYSGRPLVYRLENDKYVLYTVGPDGKDDGGVNFFDGNFTETVQGWQEHVAKAKARAIAAMAPPAANPAANSGKRAKP